MRQFVRETKAVLAESNKERRIHKLEKLIEKILDKLGGRPGSTRLGILLEIRWPRQALFVPHLADLVVRRRMIAARNGEVNATQNAACGPRARCDSERGLGNIERGERAGPSVSANRAEAFA